LKLKGLLVVGVLAACGTVLASSNSAPLPVRAVRPGGINAQPGMRPWRFVGANPDGWWCRAPACNGVTQGTQFVDRELALAADLGARNLRVEFPWPLIEPARGAFDWRRADYIVRAARRRHVPLQPVLIYTPAWAAANANDPPSADDFTRFVRAIVKRYRSTIHYWELWDEPDLERYWAGGQAAYVERIVIPGYRAIKATDRRARVILAASQKPDQEWTRGVYRFGGGSFFDILSYHDYSADRRVLANASLMLAVLREHGQGRKPIWLGEYGVQEDTVDDIRQQALIQAVMTEAAPIAMTQLYELRDDYSMTCCPPEVAVFDASGMVTHAYRKKLAYATLRQFLRSHP
jgi:hypothetical protein